MPIVAHNDLPTFARLRAEGQQILDPDRALQQDIRELHIGLLNMMPDAALAATERQFFRLIGQSNQIAQFYVHPFTLVAGVPFGGLHVATAFSLGVNTPMIYIHPPATDKADVIEGIYVRGQSCLIIDDLITGGGSILQTAATLSEAGLVVRDAVTLIDRQEGGRQALKNAGINLVAILTLEQIANYLMSAGHIQEDQYRRTVEYIAARG